MKKIILVSLCALIAVFYACAKNKDKIASDTLVISVDVPSVVLSTGSTQVLNALCKNARTDNADVAPEWSVDAGLGSFNPTKGKQTTFTAGSNPGSGKIYASYSGVNGKSNILITSTTLNSGSTGSSNGSNTTGSLTVTISPSSVAIATGTTTNLTCTVVDANNQAVSGAAPGWLVDSSLGTFSPTTGLSTTFTANSSAGTGKIYAIYSGAKGNSNIIVTTATPSGPPPTLTIYGDSGLLAENGQTPNIWQSGDDLACSEYSTSSPGAPGDTAKCMRQSFTTGTGTWFYFGVCLADTDATYKRNLTAYSGGNVTFWLKTNKNFAGGAQIDFFVQEANGTNSPNITLTPAMGWNGTVASGWQHVTIPVSSITGVNLANIRVPFNINVTNFASMNSFRFYIDYIQWSP